MDHPQIPRQIDLGQCLLRASNSHLQLQFAVTARFSPQKGCDSTGSPVNVNQWEDLSSAWVSEAPELDIGLSIKTAPDMEHAASGLAAALGDKLCTSPIWSDLGFAVRLKSSGIAGDFNTPGDYCIRIGLCRDHKTKDLLKGTGLPAFLQDPPDAHAPPGVPAITLASIDIHLEYKYPPPPKEKFCDLLAYDIDTIMDFGPWHYQPKIDSFAVATLTVSAHVSGSTDTGRGRNRPGASSARQLIHEDHNEESPSSTLNRFLQLLDLGLRKLIISTSSKSAGIRTVGKDTLQNLPQLLPAIFNPGYREAMSQRAASIPILSKALTSMLENSNNPVTRDEVSKMAEGTNYSDYSIEDTKSTHPQKTALKSVIHSSLWRIAQEQTCRPKPFKRGTSIFATDPGPDITQQSLSKEIPAQELLMHDEFDDIEFLDVDQHEDIHSDNETFEFLDDRTPLDDSETVYENVAGSTQTTMDDISLRYEPTQTSLDELPSSCEPISFDYSDIEMLL